MDKIIAFLGEYLGQSSLTLIAVLILGYFLKIFIEKRIQGIVGRVDEIQKISLDIKKEIRLNELSNLVEFRESVERWEDFLQSALFDYGMQTPIDAQVGALYNKDRELFLEVKISVVKACIFLREKELEKQLMDTVLKIRQNYYPLINEALPRLADIQARLRPYEIKLKKFEQSGLSDMTFAPNENDREETQRLQTIMNTELKIFAENALEHYRIIAVQMYDLKEAINQYIYRPIKHSAVNKD